MWQRCCNVKGHTEDLRGGRHGSGDRDPPPYRWDPSVALLRADLDAAFLHVYGLTLIEAEHMLGSLFIVREYEECDHGWYRRTRRLILQAYDRMAAAIAHGGTGWTSLANIPRGGAPSDAVSGGFRLTGVRRTVAQHGRDAAQRARTEG